MKPLVKTVATTAIVLASLAGCASRSSGGSGTSAAGAGSGTSSAPSSPSSSAPSAPAPSSPSSSAGQPPSTAPSSTGQTGASNPSGPGTVKYVALQGVTLEKDGMTLATEVNWGGCNEQPQIVVKSQDASKVVIELKTVSHYRVGIMCPNFSRNGESTVKLDAPLGNRQLIDGVKNTVINVG